MRLMYSALIAALTAINLQP